MLVVSCQGSRKAIEPLLQVRNAVIIGHASEKIANNDPHPEENPLSIMNDLVYQLVAAWLSRLKSHELLVLLTPSVDIQLDVVFVVIFENQSLIGSKRCFEDIPWPTRYADFDGWRSIEIL